MGFLNDAGSGYKKIKNKTGLTNEYFYSRLSGAGLSFGVPELGSIKALGKDHEAVVFHMERYDIYVKADNKNIEVAKIYGKNTDIGKNLAKELLAASVTDAEALDTAQADRAVEELFDVVRQIVETGSGTSKTVSVNREELSCLYMNQKNFSIRDKYTIFTQEQNPVYEVQGNLTGLGFEIKRPGGETVFTIKKKLIAVTPEYTIFRGKNKIGSIRKKIKLTRAEISGEIEGQPLTIQGDMSGFHFSVELGQQVIGSVDTIRMTWGDCYAIESRVADLQDMVVLVAVVCDNSLKGKD